MEEEVRQFPPDDCLLWSYRLDARGAGYQQSRHGDFAPEDEGFDWFHVRSDEAGTVAWMREMNLDSHVVDALSADETRPRMAKLGDGILVNLRGVNRNPGPQRTSLGVVNLSQFPCALESLL